MTDAHAVHIRTRYASRSGRVSVSKPVLASVPKPTTLKQPNHLARQTAQSHVASSRPTSPPKLSPLAASRKISGTMDVQRTSAGHVKAHRQQSAQTLMRAAVKRPVASLRRRAKAQARTDILVKSPGFAITQKLSIEAINAERLKHASHIPKNNLIRHFAPDQASWFRQQPKAKEASAQSITVRTTATAPKAIGHNRSMDIFQKALIHATAHEQPAHQPKKLSRTAKAKRRRTSPVHHRLTSVVAVSLAVVALAGIFAYQAKPAITLRFASAKAGFHATLPGYQPAGFAAGKFHYSSGRVAVQYAKAGTSRGYTISQSRSTSTAASLASKAGSYQTLQQGTNTIYLYNNGDAAWVDNGILYTITSNGNLTTGDVLAIATSV